MPVCGMFASDDFENVLTSGCTCGCWNALTWVLALPGVAPAAGLAFGGWFDATEIWAPVVQ